MDRKDAGSATLSHTSIQSLAPVSRGGYVPDMATMAEIETLAFELSDSERAILASHLLAEASRRDAELDADPAAGITLEQLDERIGARPR